MSATHDLDRLAVVAYQNTSEKVYWLKQLAYPVKSFFSYDFYPGTAVKRQPRMEGLPLQFSPGVFSRLMALSNGADVKLNMVLTAAVVVLLHKCTGERDIITAAPIYRQRVGAEFINTVLPLRHRLVDHMTFKMLLWQVRHTLADAVAHQNFPVLLLPSPGLLNLPDSHDACPLFDVAVLLQNVHDPQYIEHMKHSITFHFHRTEQGLQGQVFYNRQRYARESVEAMGQRFARLLKLLIFNVDMELCQVDMLTEEERKKILEDFNDTSMDYPVDKTIDQLFEAQAARTPKHIALIGMGHGAWSRGHGAWSRGHGAWSMEHGAWGKEHSLTYRQLNKKSNQLARLLRANGVTADTIVALLVEPSLEMIIAMMGVLKAGGAYLPIEPDYPGEQIRYILKDSRSHILLSLKDLQEVLSVDAAAAGTIYLDDEGIYKGSGANPEKRHTTCHLAYVIYTSGTTGRPKGVLVSHGSLAAYVFAFYREFEIAEQDCGIQLAPYTFDLFAEELYPLLLKGGKMVIPHVGEAVDIDRLAALIKEYRVTLVDTTPLLLNEFNKRASSLRPKSEGPVIKFISGGDVLKHAYVDRLVTIGRVYNTYGPTETTICATYHHYAPEDSNRIISIGKPIANYNIYILDEGGALQPVGVAGELCIAGPGLARGYLNQPLLTAEKFPPSSLLSFSASQLLSFSLYRTGDLARWLSGGNIQFLGRKDHQVKIRGFRVELGEIENRLSAHSAVKEVVVTTRVSNKGDRYLCAYVVGVAPFGQSPSIAVDLKKYLGRLLPNHMIPPCFISIERIPLTPNGKIDKNALPEPKITPTAAYVEPRDRVEGAIQKVWQELFDQEKIGIDDDFFELGGHSLTGIQMINTLHRRFNVKVPLLELFNTRTIRELAEYVTNASRERYTPIEPVETKEYYPLSSAQKGLYVVQQMDLDNIAYNMPEVITLDDIEKEIHKEKVEQTFEMLIQRHESLRTSFHITNGEPVQRIHGRAVFKIEYYRDDEKIIRDFVRPFDLSRAPLLRVGLIKTRDNTDVLVIDMHHIITDAVSVQVLVKDFMALYNGEELPPLNLYYKDYCQWWIGRRERKENALLKQEEYWLREFSAEIPPLNLPTDFPRPEHASFEGSRIRFEIPSDKVRALRTLALDNGATLFMVLLAVYTILLAKLSGQEDIVIGTPASGRQHPDLEIIIGMFVNMLALRNYPEGQKTFTAFLEEVKQQTLEAFENQDYPFEDLVNKVVTHRKTNRNPLFDCMFALMDTGKDEDESSGTAAEEDIPEKKEETLHFKAAAAKFDMILTGVAAGDDLYFILRYRTRLFKEEKVNMFADYFKRIVFEVLVNPMVRISEISLTSQKGSRLEPVTGEEKRQVLYAFNDTAADYPADRTIHQLFEEQMERTPHHIAVVGMERRVETQFIASASYKELNERSNQLMYLLRGKGVKPGHIVGLMKDRSIEMVIGMMAILKAGAAYLPLDPGYPKERISYMLADSNAGVLVSDLIKIIGPIGPIGPIFKEIPTHPTQLSYIIYTSGSTGIPKGVMVEHRNVVNVVTWFARQYCIGPGVHVLQLTPYTFDASVNQIFGTLLHGATLHVPGKDLAADVGALRHYIDTRCIHIINSVPMLIKEILLFDGKLESLQAVLSGADRLTEKTRDQILERGYRLYNQYGPTETTIDALTCECTGTRARVTLGTPISNVQCYILDKYARPLPIGVVGELYISGAGVTRGYLNQPELTAEKFIPSSLLSFSASQLLSFSLYRTGDLCRWLPDGSVEFLGRMDHQVKIRGYRIELGEIENQLLKHKNVKETVVLALENQEDEKDPYLCAYIVSVEGEIEHLRAYLAQYLPEYMIPRYFVFLDSIPLTSGGKIDRRVLSGLSRPAVGSRTIPPTDELEKQLADLWAEILGIEAGRIGIHDNFFALGGHSLKAMVLASRIRKAFNIECRLERIFTAPCLRPMAEFIRNAGSADALPSIYGNIALVEKREYYPQSSAQKRIFFLHRFEHIGTTYHISRIYRITGSLDKKQLEKAFNQLIRRHESLRTSFHFINDEPVQRIHDRVAFSMEQGAGSREVSGFIRPFDLSKPPLLRVGLAELSKTEHLLLFEMHHIISDGISMTVLTDEFITLYAGKEELPTLEIQYKDFAQWQQGLSETGRLKEQEDHWLNLFPDAPDLPVLHLPTDHSRPDIFTLEGDYYGFKLEPAEVPGLKQMSAANETTLFMNLLAAFNILLFKYSGQNDIIVGSGIAGRRHPELQKVIGLFVNMLPLRNHLSNKKNYREFLEEVKESCIDAFENQDFLLEELVEKLNLKRDASRNPLFDVCLVNQNFQRTKKEIKDLAIEPYQYAMAGHENRTAKFDLTLFVYEENTYQNIYIGVEYYKKIFDRDTIERMAGHFVNVLKEVIKEPGILLADIDILSEKEKNQLLFDFNDTAVPYPGNKTIHRLFEEQVEKTPDHVSLVIGHWSVVSGHWSLVSSHWSLVKQNLYLTYRLLNGRANQVANYLYLEENIQLDDRVGVLMGPSIDRVTAILGILKAGGAYVPLDPGLPEERIKTMIDDADIGVVISQKKETWRLQRLLLECLSFHTFLRMGIELFHDIYSWVEDSFSKENPAFLQVKPYHLAYVIYTSGTTGKPKGVMVNHGALFNLCSWHNRYYLVTGEDRATQYANFGFDASVWEMFPYLVKGASIYLINNEIKLDIHELNRYFEKHRMTLSFLPTQLCEQFMALRNRTLKRLLTGGDKLRVFRKNSDVRYTLYNNYGPTENTVVTTVYPVTQVEDNIPIGKPIDNNRLYILNPHTLQVQPIGIPGELYIAGDSLARGYLNNPELTAEKFIVFNRSYRSYRSYISYRSYRTGDLARWCRDGNIQFLGRLDQQVKIRGYRIELGEIETRLLTHQWVKQACVIDREEPPGNKFICAYIQMNGKSLPGISLEDELKKYLSFSLPGYMIPACFVIMEKMPFTRSGKIDRKRLPVPQMEEEGKNFIEPGNETEIKLAKIWSEVLGIEKEKIGRDSDFFQLGGYSLKATVLQSRMQETFNIILPLAEIFRTPFIRELARYIDGKKKNVFSRF